MNFLFLSFKEVETIRRVKLSLVLVCGLAFLFACVPTAMGCIDIKPGSYPSTVSLDKQGTFTIGFSENPAGSDIHFYLYQCTDGVRTQLGENTFSVRPERVNYDEFMVIQPHPCAYCGSPSEVIGGYAVQFKVQDADILKLFTTGANMDNVYLEIHYGAYSGCDSINIISNGK